MSSVCVYYKKRMCHFGNRCWNSHDLGSIRSDRTNNPVQGLIYDTTDSKDSNNSTPAAACGSIRSRCNQVQQKKRNKSIKKANETKSTWTLTNKTTGEKHKGDQNVILLETVKQLNKSENSLKKLHQRLCDKTDRNKFYQSSIESDLQCSICYELFIKPTVLNCSHTFCHECIQLWTRNVNQCPTCRAVVKSKAQCLTLDTFIEKIAEYLPEDVKTRRESIKVERLNNSGGSDESIELDDDWESIISSSSLDISFWY